MHISLGIQVGDKTSCSEFLTTLLVPSIPFWVILPPFFSSHLSPPPTFSTDYLPLIPGKMKVPTSLGRGKWSLIPRPQVKMSTFLFGWWTWCGPLSQERVEMVSVYSHFATSPPFLPTFLPLPPSSPSFLPLPSTVLTPKWVHQPSLRSL